MIAVKDLTGAQLDYWVAKALGLKPELFGSPIKDMVGIVGGVPPEFELDGPNYDCFMPSRMWAQGGPISEKAGISSHPSHSGWIAYKGLHNNEQEGPTRLVAEMRAVVASKYGDEVPDDGETRNRRTALCSECFPGPGDQEVLTVGMVLAPCAQCGRLDRHDGNGPKFTLYAKDPRPLTPFPKV